MPRLAEYVSRTPDPPVVVPPLVDPPVLPEEITLAIKAADRGAAYLEATELAGFSENEARRLFGRDPGLSDSVRRDYLTPWTAARAEKQFLERFGAVFA